MSQNLTLLMHAGPLSPDTVTLAQGYPGGGAGRAAGLFNPSYHWKSDFIIEIGKYLKDLEDKHLLFDCKSALSIYAFLCLVELCW